MILDQLPYLQDILRGGDKGGCYYVNSLLESKADVLPVPVIHVRHFGPDPRDTDPLALSQLSPVNHLAYHILLGDNLLHHQLDKPIRKQDPVPGFHLFRQTVKANLDLVLVPNNLAGGEGEPLPVNQFYPAVFQPAGAYLRPPGIQHERDMAAQLPGNIPYHTNAG